jgi:hypothetical protein
MATPPAIPINKLKIVEAICQSYTNVKEAFPSSKSAFLLFHPTHVMCTIQIGRCLCSMALCSPYILNKILSQSEVEFALRAQSVT